MNKWETALEDIKNQSHGGKNLLHFGYSKVTDYIDIVKLKHDPMNIEFCKPEFQANWNLMLELVTKDVRAYEHASPSLRDSKEFYESALSSLHGSQAKSHFYPLEFAGDKLKDDKELVMRSVGVQPFAFQHASERLRADKEIALHAVQTYGDHFVTEEILYSGSAEIRAIVDKHPDRLADGLKEAIFAEKAIAREAKLSTQLHTKPQRTAPTLKI